MAVAAAFGGRWLNAELVWGRDPAHLVALEADIDTGEVTTTYSLDCQFASEPERVARPISEEVRDSGGFRRAVAGPPRSLSQIAVAMGINEVDPFDGRARLIHDALSGVHVYRWVPEYLALPTAPAVGKQFRMESSGFGLARCLDDILGADRDRFIALEQHFRQFFPEIQRIQLSQETAYQGGGGAGDPLLLGSAPGKGISFVLADAGTVVPAAQASDGVLLVLAYLTVLHLPQPPRVLLIEEPENGIHPQRLADVLRILRQAVEAQQHTQVVMTTHSPYVLDFFEPHEVVLCRKDAHGAVHTVRLSDSPLVAAQREVFTLGEIWTGEGDEALAASATEPGV